MTDRELRVAAVEIAHFTRLNVRRADGEPRWAAVYTREVYEIGQGRFERMGRVIARGVNRQNVKSEKRQWIWCQSVIAGALQKGDRP